MNEIPARLGWVWVKRGFAALKKQPAGLSGLMFSFMLILAVMFLVPVLGPVAMAILMPAFAVGFMGVARTIALDRPVLPGQLFAGFRRPAIGGLWRLGVVHLGVILLMVLTIFLSTDMAMLGNAAPADMPAAMELYRESGVARGFNLAMLLYLPSALVIELAAALVFWSGMGPMKALFYSFLTIKRALGAFLVLTVSLFVLTNLVLSLVFMLLGSTQFVFGVLIVAFLVMYGVGHCALYAAYEHIFGAPPDDAAPPAKP